MKNIKNGIIIYNPISTGFKMETIEKIIKSLKAHGINPELFESKRAKHVIDLVKENDDKKNLIITLGGDGTVSEAFQAYNQIEQCGLYTHVPTGTTNDMKKSFDIVYKDADKIITDALNGKIETIDSFTMNDEVVAYTSVFGYLAHVPYITSSKLKKYLGHTGYVISALPFILKKPKKYSINYETNNIKGSCNCILGAVSNSKGFAGIDLYPNAELDDSKLELLLITKADPKLIASIAMDYVRNEVDLDKYKEHIITDSSSNIKLTFNNYPEYNFDNDGEKSINKLSDINNTVIYKPGKKIKILKRKG